MTVSEQHMRRASVLTRLPKQAVGCEVGVWKGDFSAELLRVADPTELHLVDPWVSRPDRPHEWYSKDQASMNRIYLKVCDRFVDDPRVAVHRAPSLRAVELFPDEYFDWVYIDGDHVYESVLDDLRAWYPKVKPGGVLCGDDYDTDHWWEDGVIRAVGEFCDEKPVSFVGVGGDQFWLVK